MKASDLTGVDFNGLVGIRRLQNRNTKSIWLFRCRCGVEFDTHAAAVKRGLTRNCPVCRKVTKSKNKTIHGGTGTPEHNTWKAMKHRCLGKNSHNYDRYGGRGISVCERWLSFENFFADMGPKPGPGFSIDRINVNGNYEPGNCRWATNVEQQSNKRRPGGGQAGVTVPKKLTWEQVREIRLSPLTNKELSVIYSVTPSNIGYIRANRIWKNDPLKQKLEQLTNDS